MIGRNKSHWHAYKWLYSLLRTPSDFHAFPMLNRAGISTIKLKPDSLVDWSLLSKKAKFLLRHSGAYISFFTCWILDTRIIHTSRQSPLSPNYWLVTVASSSHSRLNENKKLHAECTMPQELTFAYHKRCSCEHTFITKGGKSTMGFPLFE